MKKSKLILAITLAVMCRVSTAHAQTVVKQWATQYNGPSNNYDEASKMAVDAVGNVYVTGVTQNSGNGTMDYATIKYNSNGVQQWASVFEARSNGSTPRIAIDASGNVYIVGYYVKIVFGTPYFGLVTIKYNSNGTQQWVAEYLGGGAYASAIEVDVSGNVYVAGDVGANAITIKYNSNGAQQWVNIPGNLYSQNANNNLVVDASGNVYIGGYTIDANNFLRDLAVCKYNSNGIQQWISTYDSLTIVSDEMAYSLGMDAAGNIYAGGTIGYSPPSRDHLAVKFNSSGTIQWASIYDVFNYDNYASFAVDATGNCYFAGDGTSVVFSDFVTAKINNLGVQQWHSVYNGPGNQWELPAGIAVDATGNVYVTGRSYSTTTNDYATVKYNSSGVQQWVDLFSVDVSSGGPEGGTDIAVDASGNIYVTGFCIGVSNLSDYGTIKYSECAAIGISAGSPSLSASTSSICQGDSVTLSVTAGNLNDAARWSWHANGCGGTIVGEGSSVTLAPSQTTTYYVRGEGGCVLPGNCTAITITVLSATTSHTVENVCDNTLPFIWNGNNYTTSGIYVANLTNAHGCDSTATLELTVYEAATALTSITSNAIANNVCEGTSVTLTANGGYAGNPAGNIAWYQGFCGDGTSASDYGPTTTLGLMPGTYNYYATQVNICGATNCAMITIEVSALPVTVNVPNPPIAGLPAAACNGTTATISTSATSLATHYIWDGPTGCVFNGSGNPHITATPNASIVFGQANGSGYYIGVQAANACGASTRRVQWVRGTIGVPAAVTGNITPCAGSNHIYNTNAVTGATSYLWTVSGNASVIGSGTSASVNFASNFTSGTVCVAAQTTCYTSAVKCLAISTSAATITQLIGNVIACPGQTLAYSVAPVNGAATYNWTLPPGCTGTSSTNSINVTFGAGFTGGNIGVSVTSTCGVVSAVKSKTINSGVPPVPSLITGPLTGLCAQTVVYTCPTQTGVTFTWTVPPGSTINSGQGTNAISVTFGTFATSTVCVTASTSCGTSNPRCITVKGSPNAPGAITAIPSSWCANTAGVEFNVNVSLLSGSYTLSWLYPGSTVAQYVLGGGNSTSLILNWITGSGPVHVTASNMCGSQTSTSTQANNCREGEEFISETSDITVYPNPTSGKVHIEFTATGKEDLQVFITDISGRVIVKEKILCSEGLNKTNMDVSTLAKGIYMLTINNKQVKLVVE